jgi:hypothetical protein
LTPPERCFLPVSYGLWLDRSEGFICLDEEAQEFFCPPEFELQLFPNPELSPAVIAECVELKAPNDGGGSDGGDGELTQEGEQQAEAGEID